MKYSNAALRRNAWAATVAVVLLAVASAAMLQMEAGVDIIEPPNPSGRSLYVAPDGKRYHDGTIERPYDIHTLFTNSTIAQPGDVVWLRGGTYTVAVTSHLTGKPEAPIIVRQYPGERAILDAASRTASALTVKGSDTWYWGFEVTDSTTARIADTPSYTTGLRATSISVLGPRTRFINMVVHDGEQGFGFWSIAEDSELYGNLIYNVGFEAGDRGHGHSIYVQNATGVKRIVDNILFNGHSFGLHAYTEGGFVDNIHVEGNTAFNHGVLSRAGATVNYLFRSKNEAVRNPALVSNYGYYSAPHQGRVVELFTPAPLKACTNLVMTDNYFAAPVGVAATITCQSIKSLRGNVLYGRETGINRTQYAGNTHHQDRPNGIDTFIRPNRYERGRANITIFNWHRRAVVEVGLSETGLPRGARFEIRDAQNYFGRPLVAGVYDGKRVSIPMSGLEVAAPNGNVAVPPKHTGPEFGAFIVVPFTQVE